MLIAEAPVRINFGGGAADLPETRTRHGGTVIRTSSKRKAGPTLSFRAKRFLLRALIKGVRTALPGALVSLLLNVFVAQAMVVQGPSMKPNLTYNQRVIVEKVTYSLIHGPRRGDVVIVDMPGEKELLVKRVVALPGETVAVQDGQVFINGQLLEEPWAIRRGGLDYPPARVPPRHVFVLGDNRKESRDSRFFGPVPVDCIVGRVRLIVWPLDRIGPIG